MWDGGQMEEAALVDQRCGLSALADGVATRAKSPAPSSPLRWLRSLGEGDLAATRSAGTGETVTWAGDDATPAAWPQNATTWGMGAPSKCRTGSPD